MWFRRVIEALDRTFIGHLRRFTLVSMIAGLVVIALFTASITMWREYPLASVLLAVPVAVAVLLQVISILVHWSLKIMNSVLMVGYAGNRVATDGKMYAETCAHLKKRGIADPKTHIANNTRRVHACELVYMAALENRLENPYEVAMVMYDDDEDDSFGKMQLVKDLMETYGLRTAQEIRDMLAERSKIASPLREGTL